MKNNQIYFNIKDDMVKMSSKSPITILDLIQVTQTALLQQLQTVVERAPEAIRQQVKEDLYDLYNSAASSTLAYFAPDIEMRPDLTVQAILEAENKIIDEGRAPELKPKSTKKNVIAMPTPAPTPKKIPEA